MNKLIFLLIIPIIGISQNNGSKQMTLNQESEQKQKLRTEKYAPKTNTVIVRDVDQIFDQGYGINTLRYRN